MQLITGLLSTVGAAIASVLLHVAAHDFCVATPALCKWLISRAVGRLNKDLRERYREEWLADLEERETTYSKLKHAAECFFCARKMSRQSTTKTIQVSFLDPTIGAVPFIFNMRTVSIVLFAFQTINSKRFLVSRIATYSLLLYFLVKLLASIYKHLNRLGLKRLPVPLEGLLQCDYEVKLCFANRKSLDFTKIVKAVIRNPVGAPKILDRVYAIINKNSE